MATEFARSKIIPGYGALTTALIQLIRFGPGLFGALKWTVLMYHVERCDTWGSKQSDAHSCGQAMAGVFDKGRGEWIRGPAGIGETAYKRLTRELVEIDRVLSRAYIASRRGDSDAPLYQVNWTAIRNRIETYKHDLVGSQTPLFADPTPPEAEGPGATNQDNPDNLDNSRVGRAATHGGSCGDPGVGRVATPQAIDLTDPDDQSLHPAQTPAPSDDPYVLDVLAIRTALRRTLPVPESLTDTDPLPARFAVIGEHCRITTNVMLEWIHAKAVRRTAAEDPIASPGYWQTVLRGCPGEFERWIKQNRKLVRRILESDQAAARARQIQRMRATAVHYALPPALPGLPALVACPQCGLTAAVPHGDILLCTSTSCDPRGLTWRDLMHHYSRPGDGRDEHEQSLIRRSKKRAAQGGNNMLLVEWYAEDRTATMLAVSTRTVRRMAQDGTLRRAWRPLAGRKPEAVYHPEDVDREAAKARPRPMPVPDTRELETGPPTALAGRVAAAIEQMAAARLEPQIAGRMAEALERIASTRQETPGLPGIPEALERRLGTLGTRIKTRARGN